MKTRTHNFLLGFGCISLIPILALSHLEGWLGLAISLAQGIFNGWFGYDIYNTYKKNKDHNDKIIKKCDCLRNYSGAIIYYIKNNIRYCAICHRILSNLEPESEIRGFVNKIKKEIEKGNIKREYTHYSSVLYIKFYILNTPYEFTLDDYDFSTSTYESVHVQSKNSFSTIKLNPNEIKILKKTLSEWMEKEESERKTFEEKRDNDFLLQLENWSSEEMRYPSTHEH